MHDVRLVYVCHRLKRNVPAVPPRNDPRAPRRHCVSAARAPQADPKVWQHALDAGQYRVGALILPAQRPRAQCLSQSCGTSATTAAIVRDGVHFLERLNVDFVPAP